MKSVGGKLAIIVASFARLIDFSGAYQTASALDPATAMFADWAKVGDDLRAAMRVTADSLPAITERAPELVEEK